MNLSRFTIQACLCSTLLLLLHLLVCLTSATDTDLVLNHVITGPFHLSWLNKQSKYDFIFNLRTSSNTSDHNHLTTPPLTQALKCPDDLACLFRNDSLSAIYDKLLFKPHYLIYQSRNASIDSDVCEQSEVTVNHYCNTHWNPPQHRIGNQCNHIIEWHSPYSCNNTTATNYETPCYVYTPHGKLIDLTPWIKSDSSSYSVDTSMSNNTISNFELGVCNEAHDKCGPNVSACLVQEGRDHVETGFHNLTSLRYNAQNASVHLTMLGSYEESCPDRRIRTEIIFKCTNSTLTNSMPKLVHWEKCQYNIEWSSIHACPTDQFTVPATECAIRHQESGVDVDLRDLFKGQTEVEVPNVEVDGKEMSMLLGLCRGLPSTKYQCEGRSNSQVSACLKDSRLSSVESLNATNSKIVGSITEANLRFADGRLFLESTAANKTCTHPVGPNFNSTLRLGTKIEFYCKSIDDEKPNFLGFDECTYLFEWGTRKLCYDFHGGTSVQTSTTEMYPNENPETIASHAITPKLSRVDSKTVKEVKTGKDLHTVTIEESIRIGNASDHTERSNITTTTAVSKENATSTPVVMQSKISKPHKYFMIGLISFTLTGFIVMIFILDKRTRLGLNLASIRQQARQALQPQPVPYTRVGQFNDSLDL